MSKVIFSTDELPRELNDYARFDRWTELYTKVYCAFDQSRVDDSAFSARFQFAKFGNVKSGRIAGTVNSIARTPRHIAKDANDDFGLSVNLGPGLMRCTQIGRETVAAPGAAMFFVSSEAVKFDSEGAMNRVSVVMPQKKLLDLVADPEEMLGQPLDAGNPALRHLAHYLDVVHETSRTGHDPALSSHIETTLVDLIALVLGARRDGTDVASARGLRAARLQEILGAIKKGFADPELSSEGIARAIGVSRRYVNDLLHETGNSFAERVLEFRLQKARTMLADRRADRLKVHDVAFACGFNEVSYFHRCFRRRFGASPAQFRGKP